MKQLALPLLLIFNTLLFSQSKIDSLQQALDHAAHDTLKVKLLHQLYFEYENREPEKARKAATNALELSSRLPKGKWQSKSSVIYGDYLYSQSSFDSAITMYKRARKLAQAISWAQGESDALFGLGNTYYRKGNFEKAKESHEQKLKMAKASGDKESLAGSYNSLGLICSEQGEMTQAMEYFVNSSKMYQEMGHLKNYSITLMSIGMAHRQLGNYEKSKEYYLKSDSISTILKNDLGRAYVYHNLAIINKNTGHLEEATLYNNKGLELFAKLGDRKKVGELHYNQGSIFLEMKTYKNAAEAYKRSLEISKATNDSMMIAFSNCAMGQAFLFLNDFKNAENHLQQSAEISEQIGLFPIEMDSHEFLSEVYQKKGDFTKAYHSRTKYAILKDSLFTREKRELANEIEAKYQNEEKTKEIALLESEQKLQTLQLTQRVNERNAIIAFAIILLLLAALLYNQYRIKQKTNRELRALDELKSNFFANISHEFRTPLTLIKGPIEQLEQNPSKGLGMESIKMIRRNTNRVLQLVNQLLDLSKIDKGSLQLERAEGEVYKCLRGAASSFSSHAAQRRIDYKVHIPHEVYWASFDRDKLEKIVYNLLGNAFKFSDDGGTISFAASYGNNELRIVVSDTGKGIPEDKLPFIFDRFYQVQQEATREHEGSGIGLSLSKELVALMDGTITASSEINKGTTFTVALPIQKIKTGTLTSVPDSKTKQNDILAKKPFILERTKAVGLPNLLLVEDNPDMSYFIKEHLQELYHVVEAKNGKLGLKAAKQNPPDLIITDVMMPEMDGVEFCQAVKSNFDTSHVPVIMLTAKAGIENKIEGLEMGADDYLTKPFESKELLARIKNLIEQRRKLRERFTQRETAIDPKEIAVTPIDRKFLEGLLELLEREFSDSNFGVREMQSELALSKTQLHRKLKALTGESPGEVIRNFRLKRAAQLLSRNADTVTQIAYAVGFNNLSYFAKCFKELYGVTPSAY
ncbi:tetratricopeptide repeat protein [Flagellimonas algicola]|uniref:histidine kinase n=1 Tax=Flagellimonas algicola TaxID=2583815 RepID=A0ABY2WJD3_9FLAO|nr:tetratricopeptide repeat protein [Allomuricauda algicola]TMU54953.1 tetratricopeptide repeat protein [Allomuricauda algicola]